MMKEIDINELKINPFQLFGKDWMTLTAGTEKTGFNTMTVAWGHLGSVWERGSHRNCLPTAICYVRPSRYTKEYMDQEEYFTLSHFPTEYKKILGYLGSHSGKNEDKIQATGLTPVFSDGTTYFEEADMVFICRKLYQAPLLEKGYMDKELIDFNYPERDFHEMYVGEIMKVFVSDNRE